MGNKWDVFVWDTGLLVRSASTMLIHCRKKEMYRQTCIWMIHTLFIFRHLQAVNRRSEAHGDEARPFGFCSLTRDIISEWLKAGGNELSAYFSSTWHTSFFFFLLFFWRKSRLWTCLCTHFSFLILSLSLSVPSSLTDNETFSCASWVTPVFFPSFARQSAASSSCRQHLYSGLSVNKLSHTLQRAAVAEIAPDPL